MVALMLAAAGIFGCAAGGEAVDAAINGDCHETSRISRDLADQLRSAGFELASATLGCSGDLSGTISDWSELWFSSPRAVADRHSVGQSWVDSLVAAGWTARPNQPKPVPADYAIDEPSPDRTIATGSYRLELWGWSRDPALMRVSLINDRPKDPDYGVADPGDRDRLTEQKDNQTVLDHLSLAPVPGLPPVPAGFGAWLPPRVDTDRREYTLHSGGGRSDVNLIVGVAAEGLDPTVTCGTGIWLHIAVIQCLPLGTTSNGDQVYIPIRKRDLGYGPPMTVHGSTVLILDYVTLPPGAVKVGGRPIAPYYSNSREMTRRQVLTLLGSVRLPATPG